MKLQLNSITKQYGKKTALNDVTMTLEDGVYGLLGANGAGKTTMIQIIVNLLNATSGSITYNGKDTKCIDFISRVGYLPQYPQFYKNFRADEFLKYMSVMKGLDKKEIPNRVETLLREVNLENDAHKHIGKFSGGMRQRLGIAQALLNEPSLLILDEPTAGLDPKERIRFRNIISRLSANRTIILATHIVSDVEFIAKEVILLKNGEIILKNTPATLMKSINNKVWLVKTDFQQAEEYMQKFIISNAVVTDSGYELRIVSDDKPTENAVNTHANLEDVYLYYFQESDQK